MAKPKGKHFASPNKPAGAWRAQGASDAGSARGSEARTEAQILGEPEIPTDEENDTFEEDPVPSDGLWESETIDSSEGVRTPTYTRELIEADRRRREQELEGGKKHRRGRKVAAVVIVLATLVVALGVVYYIWLQIPITVTVNGTKVRAPHQGTTVETLFEQVKPSVTAGNHLDIEGGVITEGGGDPYEATVNGSDVSYQDASSYVLKGNDTVSYGNGADTTEDYSVGDASVQQPKLKMEGTQGVVFYVKQWGTPTTVEPHTGVESGKTVDVVTTQGQDCIVERANIHPDNDQKVVALTFDDGPSEYTDKYLDILDQYGIKATFCELGDQIDEYPEVSKRVVSEGDQLISHTWDHKQLTTLGADAVKSELTQSFDKIRAVAGVNTSAVRQPYGSMNADVWLASGGSMSVAVFWTHDSQDWERPGADKILANSTTYFQSGSIILMHDGGGNRDQDLEALPQIIEAWQNEGYTFVTLSELLDSDPNVPDEVASCDATLPDGAAWPTEVSSDSINNAIP